MQVTILKESGYEEALLGLSLSYNIQNMEKIINVAKNLSQKEGGHNKFLESIVLWIDVDAPRYWWSQFDTYRIGMTKQSESTMHTLTKKVLFNTDFEDCIASEMIQLLNNFIINKQLDQAKAHLPESFLQRRIICTNYKCLRNIIMQRKDHRLKQWHYFINEIYKQIKYPEFLPILEGDKNV